MDDQMLLIRQIAATNSRTAKENLIAKVDKKILYYAYHPDRKYFYKGKLNSKNLTGTAQLSDMTWRIFNLLSSGKHRGAKAEHTYHQYMYTLTPESGELFNRILNKDLKCGVSYKTINKMYPGLVPTEFCMLCEDIDMDRLSFPCYAGIKIDGDRGIFKPGKGFISRSGKEITGLDHLIEPLQRVGLPADGELRDSNCTCSASSGIVRSNAKTKSGVRFFVFDTVMASNTPFNERIELVRKRYTGIHSHIHVLPHFLITDSVRLRALYVRAVDQGHEGIVVKTYDHMYRCQRSYDWMRMVPVKRADVEVVGHSPGKKGSKHDGLCGALIVEFEGVTQKVGSGLDDEERANPPEIGDIVEVEYKGLTDYGKMRQPRYKRVRTDKTV